MDAGVDAAFAQVLAQRVALRRGHANIVQERGDIGEISGRDHHARDRSTAVRGEDVSSLFRPLGSIGGPSEQAGQIDRISKCEEAFASTHRNVVTAIIPMVPSAAACTAEAFDWSRCPDVEVHLLGRSMSIWLTAGQLSCMRDC
jgi:hypothetical protein